MMTNKNIFSTTSTAADMLQKFKLAKSDILQTNAMMRISITVLSNFSTQCLVNSVYTSLIFSGINPDIYESSFDQWEFELQNKESETYQRNSNFVLLLLSSTRLILDRGRDATKFALYLKSLLTSYREKCRSEIILMLPESLREGYDHTSFFHQSVRSLRMHLQRELEGVVSFMDIDPLIMEFGFNKWHASKFLVTSKFCCHPNCFPLFGNYISNYIQSLVRRPTRLVVMDLDDTLWHGVVGDVGSDGVGLDRDSSGHAHIMLQHYLLSLKNAGVLLATCSKNSLDTAKKVFDTRREMILKYDDFVTHEINWNPKSQNIIKILSDLNLTATGTLFLDDSKFEREEVRNSLPEITVPELPEDPECWCEFLSKSSYLTIGRISTEDLSKSSMYHAEMRRKEDAVKYSDYNAFLRSLDLLVMPEKVSDANFERVLELIHKTNQFNLTSRRLSSTELQRLAAEEESYCFCYSLKDRYSNYGIISVFIAERIQKRWVINTWLMSCRAMGRGVEYSVFDHFLSASLQDGDIVTGKYVLTDKNKPVEDLLDKMGFSKYETEGCHSFIRGRNKNPKADYIKIQ